jgi:hypothetical protein
VLEQLEQATIASAAAKASILSSCFIGARRDQSAMFGLSLSRVVIKGRVDRAVS